MGRGSGPMLTVLDGGASSTASVDGQDVLEELEAALAQRLPLVPAGDPDREHLEDVYYALGGKALSAAIAGGHPRAPVAGRDVYAAIVGLLGERLPLLARTDPYRSQLKTLHDLFGASLRIHRTRRL